MKCVRILQIRGKFRVSYNGDGFFMRKCFSFLALRLSLVHLKHGWEFMM